MKKLLLFAGLVLVVIVAKAQKLPNIQEKSLRLPETMKVDGRLSEWETLQAFNKATGVEYTLANDDKNLYLAIRSKNVGTTAKILIGGITLKINTPGKNVNEGALITYPVTKPAYHVYNGDIFPSYGMYVAPMLKDSANIQGMVTEFRDLRVFKLQGVLDTLISIYNQYNIKSKTTYTDNALVYELAVPFGLIRLSPATQASFNYSIRLNGVPPPGKPNSLGNEMRLINSEPTTADDIIELVKYPTDFSGKYTLSKK